MFFKTDKAQGGAAGTALSTEDTNKITLLLAAFLLLLVFMDLQARRHYASILKSTDIAPQVEGARARVEDLYGKAEEMPVKESVESILGEDSKLLQDTNHRLSGSDAKQSQEDDAKLNPFSLYFTRFKAGKSELVRVKRTLPVKAGDYLSLVRALQEGPSFPTEKGLLNPLDRAVHIRQVRLEGGVAVVETDASVLRMGNAIIKDRLDQLVATLLQFPEVRAVRVLVDGEDIGQRKPSLHIPVQINSLGRRVVDY